MHLNPPNDGKERVLYTGQVTIFRSDERYYDGDGNEVAYNLVRDAYKYMESVCGKDIIIGNNTVINMPISIGDGARIGQNCYIKKNVPVGAIIDHNTVWQ